MAKVKLYAFVDDEHSGDEIFKVRVNAAGMLAEERFPKTGLIIGTADDETIPNIKAIKGIVSVRTEDEWKQLLLRVDPAERLREVGALPGTSSPQASERPSAASSSK